MICAGCGHANAVGARFCEECGEALARACPGCGAELSATARFCSACGTRVTTEVEASSEAALKVVSVVFSDLVGSTGLQEALDNEATRRVMGRFYETMRTVAERFEGQIQKFIGDAVVVVFGVPAVREDDALRAVRCAAGMVAAVENLNEELESGHGVRLALRTGVNTGELVVNREGIFVGDTMNTAARLEQAAAAGEILIGDSTRRLVRDAVLLDEVEPLELKGKAAPVRAWRLLDASAEHGETRRAEAPLVGRGDELERLHRALERAATDRVCHLVTVIASPGLGKSRLAREFATSLAEEARVLEGHCEPSGEGITFLPIADVLREAAGIGEADPPELVAAKLEGVVPEEDDRSRVVRAVGSVLGIGTPASPEETFWGFRRVLESLAGAGRPLVVVLDDVHWGQPMFLDLIEHLIEWVSDAPILLVALARPELREIRAALTAVGRRALDVIDLAPLGPQQSRSLVDGLLGAVDLGEDLLERILTTTEGNPLFLSELLRMLVDEGALVPGADGAGWTAAGGTDAVQVPPTINALLTARIERLRADERTVVERASVIGKQFYRGAVAELAPAPVSAALDGHLESLRRKDMVEPEGTYWIDEPVYRFHHVLIRDAAYHLLLKEARAELHERFADWLEGKAGELVGEHEEVIAYHLEQAHEYRRLLGPMDERGRALGARATARLASAGRRALAREDLAAAANLLGRALERQADPAEEPGILWDLAEALLTAGETARAADAVASLEALDARRGAVMVTQLGVLTGAGALEESLSRVNEAVTALNDAGDDVAVAKGHTVIAQIQAQLGQVADVEVSLDRALLAARRANDRRRITAVLAAAPRAALWGPSPVIRASGRCLDVVRILRMTPGNRHVEAVALRCQAVLEAMRGRAEAAREILAAGRVTLEELGLSLELHELETHAGIVELLAGDPQAAHDLLSQARIGFTALGVSGAAAQASALLGRALVELGRFEEAMAETEFAEQHAGGDLKTTIAWLGVRAEALAREGDRRAEAVELARRAVGLAEPTDALADKADAQMVLARVAHAAGDETTARGAAKEALALYQAKDHAVGVKSATELTRGDAASAEMSSPLSIVVLGDRPPERALKRYAEAQAALDIEALVDIYTPDARMIDHRKPALWQPIVGQDELRTWLDSIVSINSTMKLDIQEVLAVDDQAIAALLTFSGTIDGADWDFPVGSVLRLQGDRVFSTDMYDPDDRDAIIARYAEVGGGQGKLGNRPPEEVTKQFVQAYGARDLDRLADLAAEDMVMVDHRGMSWEETTGREAWLPVVRSGYHGVPDSRVEIDEVLACDDRVIAVLISWRGTAAAKAGGGPFEFTAGHVTVMENGRMARVEQFDPADREGMLRRYRELGGTASILGGRQSERLLAELQRLLHRRDYERGRALVADDWVSVDHRAVGWDDYQGRDAWEETTRSFFDASPTARVDVEEVLACDDRVIAARVAWRDRGLKAGDLEVLAGAVHLFEDGRWISVDYYEPDDRRAIIARYVELGGGLAPLGDTPVERLLRHYAERYAARDLEGATATLAEHWRHTDHRQLGWAGLGRDQYRVEQVGVWESTADVRIEVDEVLACDGRVLAAVTTYYGTAAESGGGGRFEYSVGVVTVAEDGVTVMTDWYEPDDREAILARYRELGGRYESVAGHLEPDRFFAEFFDRLHARDYDRISEMVAEEWSWSDHRPLGWEPARGRAECLATMRSLAEGAPGVRIEFDEILAEDDRVLAALMSWRGRGVKAGDLEVTAGVVMVVEQGVWVKADFYDPDDRQAIIARYVELGGGLGRLGDSPPERWLAEWARRYPTADFDGMAALASPRCSFKDHRRLGWDPVQTAEGMAELGRSIWSGTSDVRLEVDEVLACNERAVAARVRVHATSRRHAIRSQTPTGAVILVEDGLLISWDQYDEADRESLMARYAELTALATPVTERWVQAYVNRFNDRDLAGVVELYSEDAELTDRRTFGGAPARGRSAIEEFFASIFDASPDMRGTIDEVIASDERVIAYVNTRRGSATIGGGPAALSMGLVQVWDDGLIISSDLYEPDDRQAMIARYAELGGGTSKLGDRAPELFWRQVAEVFAARDLERMAELVDENYRIHDHRAMAWDSIADRAQFMQLIESTFAVSRDMHLEVREVLACDDRVIALRASYRGHAVEGAGEIEVPLGYVSIVRDGQAISLDQYDADDTEAMLSRFRELTALRTAASSDPAPAPGTPSPAAADARPPASPA